MKWHDNVNKKMNSMQSKHFIKGIIFCDTTTKLSSIFHMKPAHFSGEFSSRDTGTFGFLWHKHIHSSHAQPRMPRAWFTAVGARAGEDAGCDWARCGCHWQSGGHPTKEEDPAALYRGRRWTKTW